MKPKKIESKLTKALKKLGKVTEKVSRLESKLAKSNKAGDKQKPDEIEPTSGVKTTTAGTASKKSR